LNFLFKPWMKAPAATPATIHGQTLPTISRAAPSLALIRSTVDIALCGRSAVPARTLRMALIRLALDQPMPPMSPIG
jgi:hypothetical protein